MNLSVLVPTYRRPAYLSKCLHALERQTRLPYEVLLVVRDSDTETLELLQHCSFSLPLRVLIVEVPGQVAALNAGLQQVNGDVVAMTDDDAAPRPDWLQRIETHFELNSNIAGVGGRDYLLDGQVYSDASVVGKIQWFGRHIGNHHRGVGQARYVDVLKGANMSYRMSAIAGRRFDTRLWGAGAQICNDMSFSLRLRRDGWLLLYDPSVTVDHFSAERFDDDRRSYRSLASIRNEAHNETLAILEYFPRARWTVYMAWAILVGHRSLPGAVQCVRLAVTGHPSWPVLKPVVEGRLSGLTTLLRSRDTSSAHSSV